MARALGIDLGTTFSLAAYVDERNRARAVPLAGASPLLPSAVAYGDDGAVEVGAGAAASAAERPHDVVLSVKRLMGRGAAELGPPDRALHLLDEVGAVLRLRVGGGRRSVSAVEVSAEILRAVARGAREHLGEALGGCVITVPAYFDDAQRQATRDAGRLAGLEVVRLLNEPTAAAIAYGLDLRRRGRFAVFDLGGGTFDVSILRLEEGVFEVLATGGDTRLGGDDLDRALAERLLGQDRMARAGGALLRRVLTEARRAREALSAAEEVEVEVPAGGGDAIRARLRREELEEVLRPVVERTTAPCVAALHDAGLSAAELDGVVLVGGATRTPLVRRHARALFGREPLTDLDPDVVVALGAAIQADALARGGREDLLLLDVIPLSLGVETMGGVVERLLERNTTIPAAATQQFTTWADGQGGMVVHVVQGERELARDCRSLARFTLRGIPPLPAAQARVEITYAIDADGILAVSARELTTGVEQAIQVKPTYGLSEEEVERMLVEGLEHASDDVAARFQAEWRVEGQRLADALREALAADGDLLDGEERADLERRLDGLRGALAGDDPLALQAWIDSADAAARPFMERRLDRHVGRALTGRRVDDV